MGDIFIYGQIGKSLFEEGITLENVKNQLDKTGQDVTVRINSNGGDVREGFAIHDLLINSGKKITTLIDGKCYSIATIILFAGETREMQEHAELMIHNPWGKPEGDADEIIKYGKWVKEQEERMASFYSEKTGVELDIIKAMMKETTFMKIEKAIENKFVTKISEPMKAVALITDMDISKEDKSWLKKKFEAIENLFIATVNDPKNIVVKVDDGSEIFIETEDDTLVGKKVFQVKEGERSEDVVTDGTYTLEDGRKITVAGGVISAVDEAVEDSEVETLKAELEALKAEKAESDAKAEETETKLEEEKEKVQEVQASLKEIKTKVFGETPIVRPIKNQQSTEADAGLDNWGKSLIKDRG